MRRPLLFLTGLLLALLVLAAPASADFGFKDLSVEFEDASGFPVSLAGAHPYAMTTTINMNTVVDPDLGEVPDEALRDLVVELPPGFVGDPKAAPACPTTLFRTTLVGGYSACPDESTIGTIDLRLEPGGFVRTFPVFNLPPSPGGAARIGFLGFSVPVSLGVGLNEEAPNNLVSKLVDVPQTAPFYGSDLTLWGDPADPSHDSERGGCLNLGLGTPPPREDCSVDFPQRAFLTLPRSCTGPLSTFFKARSWQVEGRWIERSTELPEITGCSDLGLNPTIEDDPTTHRAGSASGLDFTLKVNDPGLTDPSKRANSDIKKAQVTLPAGMVINPSQADGLSACSESEFARQRSTSVLGDGCPAQSRIGTVEVKTPLLEGTVLRGNVFVATPHENPFGTLVALYMTISEPEMGINVRLAGKVVPVETGPNAGQLVTTFDNLPQLPFSEFHFHFRGGERSALITPSHCGDYTTEAVLTPWANPGETVTTTSSFHITEGAGGGPCVSSGPLPFHPAFSVGTVNNRAGSFSPLAIRLTKGDGEQEITRFDSVLPPGLTGKLAGIGQCPDAQIQAAKGRSGREELASPSCPPGSRLGSVLAGSGAGSALTFVSGSVYLSGPFGGSPLSIVVITPAVAGPFDLGTVVIREGLDLDPLTAEVKVDGSAGDLIPRFLQGIPLKLRDLRVNIDRENFTLNATGCDVRNATATLFGVTDPFGTGDGSTATRSDSYQASQCQALGFRPKLTLALKGGTKRRSHPAVRSVLLPRAGDSNFSRAVVLLPHSEQIDNAHINTPCTRVQFDAKQCPPGSILGTARAFTPLLDQPLEGPVYFRSNGGERELPDIVADLHGQFHVILIGFIDAKKARIRTTFANIPDAPVSKFVLNLDGGKKGLLVNNRNLCAQTLHTGLRLTAQNGRLQRSNPILKTSCRTDKKRQVHKKH